jgi:hypothetical protein
MLVEPVRNYRDRRLSQIPTVTGMAMRIAPKKATFPRVSLYPYSFPNEMAAAAVSSAAIAATIKERIDAILIHRTETLLLLIIGSLLLLGGFQK